MSKYYSIGLDTIVTEHGLTVAYRGADYDRVRIHTWDISRPALPLAGFYDYFDAERVQVIGKLEITYLSEMSPERRWNSVERFIGSGIRFFIVAHGMSVPDEMMRSAANHEVTILTTEQSTSDFMAQLIFSLNSLLAPRTTLHGVLMEIRGIGLVDARTLFGIGSVKQEQAIDLAVRFEPWDDDKQYDRLGAELRYTEILGVQVPYYEIPVRPGRNLADILELAARHNRGRKMGYNAAQELVERHDRMVDQA